MAIAANVERDDFVLSTNPYRRELLAHCYRMLGSVIDAEDAVQETYLNAWRSYDTFEGRSSVRAWLYQIATRVCLKALERGRRLPLPSGLGPPGADPQAPLRSEPEEVLWLQPIPDSMFIAPGADPATVVESRHHMRLALIAALQCLPPQQRAVLLLRDVLEWRAAEAANLLGTTTAAVNSLLQRARARLERVPHIEDELSEPTDPGQRDLLDRYVAAFEEADLAALTSLMREDVSVEMPPYATWFAGREQVMGFLGGLGFTPGLIRPVPTSANGQPALGWYMREETGEGHHVRGVHVLTLTPTGVARIVAFLDPTLAPMFNLPPVLHNTPGD